MDDDRTPRGDATDDASGDANGDVSGDVSAVDVRKPRVAGCGRCAGSDGRGVLAASREAADAVRDARGVAVADGDGDGPDGPRGARGVSETLRPKADRTRRWGPADPCWGPCWGCGLACRCGWLDGPWWPWWPAGRWRGEEAPTGDRWESRVGVGVPNAAAAFRGPAGDPLPSPTDGPTTGPPGGPSTATTVPFSGSPLGPPEALLARWAAEPTRARVRGLAGPRAGTTRSAAAAVGAVEDPGGGAEGTRCRGAPDGPAAAEALGVGVVAWSCDGDGMGPPAAPRRRRPRRPSEPPGPSWWAGEGTMSKRP